MKTLLEYRKELTELLHARNYIPIDLPEFKENTDAINKIIAEIVKINKKNLYRPYIQAYKILSFWYKLIGNKKKLSILNDWLINKLK